MNFPRDVWGCILRYLDELDMKNLRLTCVHNASCVLRYMFVEYYFKMNEYNVRDKAFQSLLSNMQNVVLNTANVQNWSWLPLNIKKIHLFNITYDRVILPMHIKTLIITTGFDGEIPTLPSELTELEVHCDMHIILPSSLQRICIRYFFNHPINIGVNITWISISGHFNRSLGTLPPNLKTLRFHASDFYHPLGKLPDSLEVLTLPFSYDFPLDNLPLCLRKLDVGGEYNHPLGILPSNLEYLKLSSLYSCPLGVLPETLRTLHTGRAFYEPLGILPDSLVELVISSPFFNHHLGVLPSKLSFLLVGHGFNQPLGVLPLSLKKLSVGHSFAQEIDYYPPNLKKIHLRSNMKYRGSIPAGIKVKYIP